MSAELAVIKFLKKLPARERNLYFLLQSYRDSLSKFNDCDVETRMEACQVISEYYEGEINKILSEPVSPTYLGVSKANCEMDKVPFKEISSFMAIYENHQERNEKAEKSSSEVSLNKKSQIIDNITLYEKQLDEKLGAWASSFSSDDEIREVNNGVYDKIDRLSLIEEMNSICPLLNEASDLSSEGDQSQQTFHV